ncbi:MAG: TIGR02147 family protein [Bdellovibrionia bacterium]
MGNLGSQKLLFEYEDYRMFLRDYYEDRRARDGKFSFRFFSRITGFKSSGSILKVMKGLTNLSREGIDKICAGLKLNKEESEFFGNLVGFNQAQSPSEKEVFARQILQSRSYRKIKPLSAAQFKYYSQWYYSPIREIVALPGFREDPQWIVEALRFPISPAQAKDALDELQELGLIVRKGGRLVQTDAHIATADEVSFSGAAHCHRQFLARASESIDAVPRENRDLSAMTIGVSAEMAVRLKEMIQKFRKDVVKLVSEDSVTDVIYQLNMQLFPLTKDSEKEKK